MKIKIGTNIIEADDCRNIRYYKSLDKTGYISVICTLLNGTYLPCDINNDKSLLTFIDGLNNIINLNITIDEIKEELNIK